MATAEAGTDKETLASFRELEEMEAKLAGYEARVRNLEKRIDEVKVTSSRLEVGI